MSTSKENQHIVDWVSAHRLELTYAQLADKFKRTEESVRGIIKRAKMTHHIVPIGGRSLKRRVAMKASQVRKAQKELIPAPKSGNKLIIGDLHEPFALDEYLPFCKAMYKKYNCKHVIFIGDIIDNHFPSFHTTDPDGLGGQDELDYAIARISRWVKAFPKADVILGNHDRLIMRKAFEGAIPSRWIREYADVLNAPGWDFVEERIYDGVHYIHGEGPTARNRCRKDLMSTVQGHRHPEAYVEYVVGQTFRIFGMQVGCGVNRKSYALAYAKNHPKPAISVGLVLNNGTLGIVEMMHL